MVDTISKKEKIENPGHLGFVIFPTQSPHFTKTD